MIEATLNLRERTVSWTFLLNHGHVLVRIAKQPDIRVTAIAHSAGVGERAADRIVASWSLAVISSSNGEAVGTRTPLTLRGTCGSRLNPTIRSRTCFGLSPHQGRIQIMSLRKNSSSIVGEPLKCAFDHEIRNSSSNGRLAFRVRLHSFCDFPESI